jgi:hypothetical protein
MLNLKHIEQDIESVVAGADPDAIDMLAEHCQTLINEVERLRRECHDLEAVVGNYCTTLLWIANHDQTMKPNGGDPEWFAEQAPIRARRALTA